MSIHTNFRAKIFQKPLFRFIPRLPILPDLELSETEQSLVLDPIGNQPFFLSDIVSKGAKVISTPVNPVERLTLDCLFDPPIAEVPNSFLNKFFDIRQGDQRLEQHLRGLFRSQCDQCGREIFPKYFIRDGTTGELRSKTYQCECGVSGSFPVSEQDQRMDMEWRRSDGMYRSKIARAFAGVKDVTSEDVLEVLAVYSPRVLYALDLISQKLLPLFSSANEKYFKLLLLTIADSVSGLWNLKDPSEPPKSIYKPKQTIEFNIWLAIEEAIELLRELSREKEEQDRFPGAIKLQNWSEVRQGQPPIKLVTAIIPRPNQAYWGLCALWSRWLLGLPIEHLFLGNLERKKIDWDWFYDASLSLNNRIGVLINRTVQVSFVLLEKEPDYTASFLFAMNNAGYKLSTYKINPTSNTVVLRCLLGKPTNEISAEGIKRSKTEYLARFVTELLTRSNGPMPYEYLLVEILCRFSLDGAYFFQKKQYKAFIRALNDVLMNGDFEDIENRSAPETGTWKVGGSGAQGQLL